MPNLLLAEEKIYSDVYQHLLNKARENDIDINKNYSLKNLSSIAALFNELQCVAFAIREASSTKEKARSLARCFVCYRTSSVWKKALRLKDPDGLYWPEPIDGKRDPEIDSITDRYVSFLVYKARKKA